jgi:hypothetical protein
MVHPSIIESRLGELGFRASRWFRAEVLELQHILMDHEKIIALACGRYFGSFALLVATDQRLLMIDKRVFFMNYEDTRYDMISEIDFNSQVYCATLTVFTVNKTHKFTTYKYKKQLRDITNYIQSRVAELRNQAPAVPMPDNVLQRLPGYQQVQPQMPPAQPYQPVHTSAPPSMAAQANDYYVDDKPADSHMLRERVGNIAHKVGSAATSAAHMPVRRPFNPYVQGSLMTRRPYGGGNSIYDV